MHDGCLVGHTRSDPRLSFRIALEYLGVLRCPGPLEIGGNFDDLVLNYNLTYYNLTEEEGKDHPARNIVQVRRTD